MATFLDHCSVGYVPFAFVSRISDEYYWTFTIYLAYFCFWLCNQYGCLYCWLCHCKVAKYIVLSISTLLGERMRQIYETTQLLCTYSVRGETSIHKIGYTANTRVYYRDMRVYS